jgi:hypothetical protein
MLREVVDRVARDVTARRSASLGISAAAIGETRERIARAVMAHALRGERDAERLRRAALDAVRG